METLAEIEAEVNYLASRIGAAGTVLPTYGRTEDFARPHIEVDTRGYHFVVVERGEELRRDTTRDLSELLYFVFETITFSLACKHELHHRVSGQDVRRLLFAKQVELLSSLSPEWAERESREHEQILLKHPFRDD